MTTPSIRSELRRIYESNIRGASALGQQWAVDDFRARIRHLDRHPRGPLTVLMRRDAAHFAGLIAVSPGAGRKVAA